MMDTKDRIKVIICIMTVVWGVMFTTDCVRCSHLKEPVFVVVKAADDNGSGTYSGLGYTVELVKNGGLVVGANLMVCGKYITGAVRGQATAAP